MAASRRAAPRASPAAATTARSPSATGIPSAPTSMATSRPTRSIPNIIYGGKVTRFNRITGEVEHVQSARQLSLPAHRARCSSLRRSARPLPRRAGGVQDHRRRQELGGHQPRSVARDLRAARQRRRPIGDAAKQQATRRGVVYSLGPSRLNVNVHLGGHRRWPDPRHPRRRQDLEERHAARHDALEQGRAARRLALRRRHRLRRRQPPAPRRPEAAHLSHPRWRRDLEGDRPRPARCARSTPSAKIPCARACSSPPPNSPSSSPSTMATTGSRCASTCPPRRSAIWWFTTTIWWSARTAAASGFSTTSPRCAS